MWKRFTNLRVDGTGPVGKRTTEIPAQAIY